MAMGWYERVISMDGKLHGKARSDRRLLFLMSCVIGVTQSVMLLVTKLYPHVIIAFTLQLGCQFLMIALCVCGVRLTHNIVRAYVVVLGITIVSADISFRSVALLPIWPTFVLLADLSLVVGLGSRFATWLMGFTALWVIISVSETILRFGLFDLPGSAPDWYRWEVIRGAVECTDPPCPVSPVKGMFEMEMSLIVLVVDFMATRGFAESAEREKAAMGRTIETVEAIARLLAGYDVDTVAEMLQEAEAEGRLPAAMHEALHRLEQNLRAYRSYLPAVLLEEQQQHSPDGAGRPCVPPAAAPGANSERAAIVFTDIRASTSIWEAAPEAMKKAMVVHDSVIRSALSAWGGYEVKTIGDAFMVAFKDAHAGVCFGLEVQERLFATEWPAALLEVGICSPTELWGGLTVRVGVNEGPVTLETNTLTGRVDYFGHTVNVAARLESVCVPGAVAVPAELWTSVRGVSGCVGAYAGNAVPTDLKGVSEPVPVCSVWPASLHGRERHPLQAAAPRHESCPSLGSDSALMRSTSQHDATVAATTLISMSLGVIDAVLVGMGPLLEQSGGVLMSLIGNNFFIGWNVGKKKRTAHAESALRFAQRLLQHGGGQTVATLGIASGTVEHGDVGTARQRFVTASGGAVEASLALRRLALSMHMRCLYTAQTPMGAVHEILRATTTRVPQHDGPDSVVYEMKVLPQDEKDAVFSPTDL